jgi:hypothetical protein
MIHKKIKVFLDLYIYTSLPYLPLYRTACLQRLYHLNTIYHGGQVSCERGKVINSVISAFSHFGHFISNGEIIMREIYSFSFLE